MSAAVAGLCLLGVLGVVPASAAADAAGPGASFSCGSFDHWGSAPAGSHFSATAVLGSTAATLEGTIDNEPFTRGVASPTLAIRDGDTTVRSGPIDAPMSLESPTETATAAAITPDAIVRSQEGSPDLVVPLCVARFAGNRHPVVLMGMFTGGAHCCTVLRAYPLAGSRSGPGIDVWIGNPGVDVRANPSGRGTVIVTGDDVFNYQFAAYAFSGVPIRVLTFRKGGFADTTRDYPDLVRRDAARWWKSFSDDPAQGLGTLAAWAADQCLLGRGRSSWATIDRMLAEGKLAGPPDAGNLWPTGAAYVAALHTFLPEHGYCR